MTAQDIAEALQAINPISELGLRAAHVIEYPDRDWKPRAHPEYPFLKYFFYPKFIVIVSQQIHVYIIGEKEKGNKWHIINLEGFHADHFVMSQRELTHLIKATVSVKIFMPDNIYDRIIYIDGEELFIFNRLNCNMFTSKSKWSIGAAAIYDVDSEAKIKERNTNAYEILNEIYKECFIDKTDGTNP